MKRLCYLIVFWIFVVFASTAFSAEGAENPSSLEDEENWSHFENLIATIKYTREQLGEKRTALINAVTDREKERITQEIEQLSQDVQSLQLALEMLLTGGADIRLFGMKTEEKVDWREQLESVFEPILVEMRRLTERPRKIERLKGDIAFYQERLDVAEAALLSVSVHRENAPTAELKQAFAAIEERWRHRRNDLKNRLSVAEFELKQTLRPTRASQRDPADALKELLGGRVLNLFFALVVMAIVYGVLKYLARLYHKAVMRRAQTRTIFIARFVNLLFYSLTGLIVLLSGMAVFYVRGDWILLTLLLIGLAGAAWALQKYLPRFVTEMKIMLNLGPVREGERLVYNGLPWQVNALTFYATLVNPVLQGGTLRVPVKELVSYQSRKYDEREPWFPSNQGDFVLFDDGTYGEVVVQTPEVVQVKVLDSIQTLPSTAYLERSPRNLSQDKFSFMMVFGLDYQHQREITTSIVNTMQTEMTEAVRKESVGEYMDALRVEFEQAGVSSLDLVIIATFAGAAADRYLQIRRMLQKNAVDVCNRHDWVIPFNQLTVHTVKSD